MNIPKYVTIEKEVGETPLSAMEAWRSNQDVAFANLPLAYAGRLDPMASGRLLVLIGEECKVQEKYHSLDKHYEFSVLFGIQSDTDDVLGRLTLASTIPALTSEAIEKTASTLVGQIALPYPHFSSKTVQGKPLHTWTLEGRLNEITIPTNTSRIYNLQLSRLESKTRAEIYHEVSYKIETIPPVTDIRKSIGNDFRRSDVRTDWKLFAGFGNPYDQFTLAHFNCIASSGTYMRSLAHQLGTLLGTQALAYHIHRTTIGTYQPVPFFGGVWLKKY